MGLFSLEKQTASTGPIYKKIQILCALTFRRVCFVLGFFDYD